MQSKARFLGHPIHQMLIAFPVGLLAASVVVDILHLITPWLAAPTVAYGMLLGGVIGGVAAAPFGFIDWLAIPAGTRARRVGAIHGAGNVVVLALFGLSAWLRSGPAPELSAAALAASLAGLAVAGVTVWLGGELVCRLGIGVADGAHPDAPSSLRHPSEPRKDTPHGNRRPTQT